MGIALAAILGSQIPQEGPLFHGISGWSSRVQLSIWDGGRCKGFVGGAATALSLQRLRIHAVAEVSWPRYGLWRSLVSALVWGTRGRRFKSSQPDSNVVRH